MFTAFARWMSRGMGSARALGVTIILCVVWIALSPVVDHGMNWKGMLLMNIPTLVTLLMVILVQHTQNHHDDAVQVKLDELIRAVDGARNVMMNLENLSPEQLAKVKAQYEALGDRVRAVDGPELKNPPEVSAPE